MRRCTFQRLNRHSGIETSERGKIVGRQRSIQKELDSLTRNLFQIVTKTIFKKQKRSTGNLFQILSLLQHFSSFKMSPWRIWKFWKWLSDYSSSYFSLLCGGSNVQTCQQCSFKLQWNKNNVQNGSFMFIFITKCCIFSIQRWSNKHSDNLDTKGAFQYLHSDVLR